ncbi:MAG: NYN domain-containing protein [Ilumatobacteraceae bacterium]
MSEGAEIEHRHLRSAIEFAVLIAEQTQRRKPPMAVPNELRLFFGKPRVPSGALGRLRRSIEADDVFRSRIAAGASPELVDDVGRLWLQRPDGWVDDALAAILAAETERAAVDGAAALRRAEKRRLAAEESAVRARAEAVRLQALVDEQRTEIDRLVADVDKANDSLTEMRAELIDVRNEARHARDREAAATAKLERTIAASGAENSDPRVGVDDTSAAAEMLAALRAEIDAELGEIRAALSRSTVSIDAAIERASAVLHRTDADAADGPHRHPSGAPRRRPLRLPGGVLAASAEAAAHLVRSGARVLIDGYNVSMLGWPNLSIDEQRSALVNAVENMTLRHGTDATVVFDGADVVGAHSLRRRSTRVVFSPSGVIADDVIRAEVERTPAARHVVVVTNDAAIARDVRAAGANVLPSNALLAVL